MFRGRFDCKADPKGRLSLPSAYKQNETGEVSALVITNSQYQGRRCLDVYSLEAWQSLEKRIASLPQLKSSVQAFRRFYLAGGQVVKVDTQGRLIIPQALRSYSDLGDDLVLVGMGEKFELWSQSTWLDLYEGMATGFEDILADVSALEGDL